MVHQQQYTDYSESRQPQYHEQWPAQQGQHQGQPTQYRQQYAQHQQQQDYEQQGHAGYEGYEGYDDYGGYGGYDDQYRQHEGQQQPHGHQAQQQHPGHNHHHNQHYYDDGHDQWSHGHEQWDNGHYNDQQGGWGQAQQQAGYHGAPGHTRQAARPQGQGRRALPPDQHAHEQPPRSLPQQDSRSKPLRPVAQPSSSQGRGNGQPASSQGRSAVQRPPGLDRSLLSLPRPKALPQDNPFPTFPTQKPKHSAPVPAPKAAPVPVEAVTNTIAQMDMNGGAAPGRPRGASNNRGPPMQAHRGPQQDQLENNARQDSGHFEGHKNNQGLPPGQALPAQRPPPMPLQNGRGRPEVHRTSDPKSPSQRVFGPSTQRSATMPYSLPSEAHSTGHGTREQWAEPGIVDDYRGPASPTFVPPRPSTAGGSRNNDFAGLREQRPPIPQAPPAQQQYRPQCQPPVQAYQAPTESHGHLDNLYDEYYDEDSHRKSIDTTLDMPNFDAIPETNNGHRRGDSIDNHLTPAARPPPPLGAPVNGLAPLNDSENNAFQRQASRSRSQPDLHSGFSSGVYETPRDAPPIPNLSRANTGFVGSTGPPIGRGHAPPRPMSGDNMHRGYPQHDFASGQQQNFDPRNGRQPPLAHRAYSDDPGFSEPAHRAMRNVSSPVVPGHSIPRPGTTGPMAGRIPHDPLGRRPGTTQPMSHPDALPSHPAPIRPGLMQQQQIGHPTAPNNGRPTPVRQYNSEAGRVSLESQNSLARRQSEIPHPVTYDELNRLRNSWKSNPSDMATGMRLAKKLVEASNALVDEGGTADARTKNKNRERLILEAHKTIKKLVNSGSADAMFYLADCYGQGLLGLQVDTKEAFTLYQSAAKAGHAASAYRTAVCCEMGHEEGGGTKRDPMKAVQWYRRAAALGDAPALYKMGMILLKGLLGQQKNFGEAINMLKRAADRADRDNPHALHELGLIYEAQTGNERIIRDEAYALQLFHQAADLGYKFSQFRLGQAYEYGLLGCPIEARTSIAWYSKAAAQGEHQSELALSGWYLTGTSGILEQSDTEAYLWARKAACAEPPLAKALFAMGYFTEVGIGCPNNLAEAKQWYGRAAAFKFPKAQERLEELKKGGTKAQMKRERLSRTNQRQQEENCTVM